MPMMSKPGRDRWIPWTIFGGFAVVVAVNATLIFFATATFSGIETERHYERGLAYNETIAAAERQAARGWRLEPRFESRGAGAGRLTVSFADRDGAPLVGAAVHAYFVRPTQAGFDVDIPLAERGGGRYAADVALPLPGQWELRVVAERADAVQQARQRIFVTP